MVFAKIGPTILLPLVIVILLQWLAPKANDFVARFKGWSFYLWAMALMVTIGQTIDFIYVHPWRNDA